MNSKIRSSSSSTSSHGLKGPRPTSLSIAGPTKIAKKPGVVPARPPVVVYLRSPKIIHVAPEDFMGLVQRLTGIRTTTEPNALRCSHNDNENILIDQILNSCTARNIGGHVAADEGLDFGVPTMRASSAHSFDVRMC